jgi:hypothetical protein
MSRMSSTHLALEAVQYALLAIVSVLVAVVVIATFIRIVNAPAVEQDELPAIITTVPTGDSVEATATLMFAGI